ncbi:MAG: cytochrome c3 family protein [Raoultibacter sp.]
MLITKNKTTLLAFLMALMLVLSVVSLGGCAPKQSATDKDEAPASYPVGSLKAVHTSGQLDNAQEYTSKLCLSCHNRETINKANENYGGTEGFNPHKSHNAAGDCTTCHSVDGTSTLTCNSCHNENLPEGWQSAERGSGPIHDLSPEK